MVDHVMQKMSAYMARGMGGSRVRHPLHGMSVPHTVSEKQSYHPLTSWKTPAGEWGCRRVRLQERLPTQDVAVTIRGWEPTYPTHFCLSWTVKGGSPRAVVRDGSKERLDVILMTTPPVRAGGAKKQQGHGVYKPSSPRGTSSVATQSHWATCPHSKPTL